MASEFMEKVKMFILKSKRVWLVLKRPSKNEYETIAKVSAIGILILGLLGFVISALMKISFG